MVSQAEIIRDLIFTNWALTGRLSKTETADMKEIVRFFDHWEVFGNEWPKAIIVEKINADEDENTVFHPNFTEVSDVYEIKCRFRITDVQQVSFSESLQDVEDMAREVQRILRITFNPSTATGTFFVTRSNWRKEDHKDQAQPEFIRILSFQLTQIRSEEPEVFRGFGGVLVFDNALSQGDSKPGSNFEYSELRDVSINEGYTQIEYLTKDQVKGRGVPLLRRGMFRGRFTALMQAKKSDIVNAGTINLLSEIYKVQTSSPSINQNAEVVMLHANQNQETIPKTLTTTSFMIIENMEKINGDEQLLAYRLTGKLSRPTLYGVTP